jgi:hypothetical protein
VKIYRDLKCVKDYISLKRVTDSAKQLCGENHMEFSENTIIYITRKDNSINFNYC